MKSIDTLVQSLLNGGYEISDIRTALDTIEKKEKDKVSKARTALVDATIGYIAAIFDFDTAEVDEKDRAELADAFENSIEPLAKLYGKSGDSGEFDSIRNFISRVK